MTTDAESQYISTVQAAAALGVGVSTVKRWVDEGILPAHRTAGGHRKLLRAEVLVLARQGDLPSEDLAGLVFAAEHEEPIDAASLTAPLHAALLRGDATEARALVRRAYRSGVRVEVLADQAIAPAMQRVGHEWQTDRIDIWQEHRGTQICVAALLELQSELEKRAERSRPVAVGGAPEGDPYQLATLLSQLVLLDAGWEAINLGPNTPLKSFTQAVRDLRPRLMWISASHLLNSKAFTREYRAMYQEAERAGVAIAVGGRALTEPVRSQMPYTTYGDRLDHLAAFARTLHPRRSRPSRGRPRKD